MRSRTLQLAAIGGLLSAALLMTGCGTSIPSSTPEEVFETAKKAGEQKDYKRLMQCYTEEAQTTMAGGMVFVTAMMRGMNQLASAFGGDKAEEETKKFEKLDAVLKKHGVTEEYLEEHKVSTMMEGNPEEAMATLGKPIKDKPAFIAEVLTTLEQLSEKEQNLSPMAAGQLEDVEIDGDKATGTLVVDVEGNEIRQPIEFKKTSDGWRIGVPPRTQAPIPPVSPM